MIRYFHHLVLKTWPMFCSPVGTMTHHSLTYAADLCFHCDTNRVVTFAGAEKRGVDEQQQDVVQEALQHRRLHASLDQILRADRRPADEQRQDLAHPNGLQKLPVEEEHHRVLRAAALTRTTQNLTMWGLLWSCGRTNHRRGQISHRAWRHHVLPYLWLIKKTADFSRLLLSEPLRT